MAAKKPPAAPRKTTTPKASSTPSKTPSAHVRLTRDELERLISEAAYFRAKKRGFEPGHELEDWIQAEAEVMRRLERRSL